MEGEGLAEAININKTLGSLTKVFSRLSKGQDANVAYGDTELTKILKGPMDGGQTFLVATVYNAIELLKKNKNGPPIRVDVGNDTKSTLRIAETAIRIKPKLIAQGMTRSNEEIEKRIEELEQKLDQKQLVIHALQGLLQKKGASQREIEAVIASVGGSGPMLALVRAPSGRLSPGKISEEETREIVDANQALTREHDELADQLAQAELDKAEAQEERDDWRERFEEKIKQVSAFEPLLQASRHDLHSQKEQIESLERENNEWRAAVGEHHVRETNALQRVDSVKQKQTFALQRVESLQEHHANALQRVASLTAHQQDDVAQINFWTEQYADVERMFDAKEKQRVSELGDATHKVRDKERMMKVMQELVAEAPAAGGQQEL